jgi:hypothetical protein
MKDKQERQTPLDFFRRNYGNIVQYAGFGSFIYGLASGKSDYFIGGLGMCIFGGLIQSYQDSINSGRERIQDLEKQLEKHNDNTSN